MNKSKPLVFFGTEDFSAVALRTLIDNDWNISLVITRPDSKRGRGQKLATPAVKDIALSNSIPCLQPTDLSLLYEDIKKTGANTGVLVSYGRIVPGSIIDLFKVGIVNAHPSLLPKYRGPSPIEAAILNGDKETGVTLMKLVPKMDAGPIYAQQKLKLNGNEDRITLYDVLAKISAQMLVEHLPAIIDGNLLPHSQDDSLATYTELLSKSDGELNLNQTCSEILRKIRAYQAYPKPRLSINGQNIIILEAKEATTAKESSLIVACHEGSIEIKKLIAPSGKVMSGEEFIRGYKKN